MNKDTDKNLKDSNTISDISIMDISYSISYKKVHKLIAALYMVTDIIDKEEPIRNKLRHLGAEIISDMHSVPAEAGNKISETVSFLNIASAMSFISEMNCSILKKEFFELKTSIQESINMKPTWLAEFFGESAISKSNSPHPSPLLVKERGNLNSKGHSIGHKISTRLGVQKGSTLMQALSNVQMSNKTHMMSDMNTNQNSGTRTQDFNLLKQKRRDAIINIIKNNGGNASIKDIRDKINIEMVGDVHFGEKTLQRELVSMTKDGVLNKTGEKRWSRYSIRS